MNQTTPPAITSLLKTVRTWLRWGVILLILFLLFGTFSPFVTISAGHRGVVFDRLRGGVQELPLGEGLKFKVPFFQSVIEVPVQTQRIVFTSAGNTQMGNKSLSYMSGDFLSRTSQYGRMLAASSDLQDVYVDAVITYHLEASTVSRVYQEVGLDYETKKVVPNTIDAVKTHTAKFKVADILTKREEIRQRVFDDLSPRLAEDGIILEDVNLTNFDFNQQFKEAIELKQIEEQKAQKEEYVLRQKEIEVQQKIKIAEAEKQAKILEGEGIAEFNQLIQQEITTNVLEYKRLENEREAISKWGGLYPTTYFGDSEAVPLISIGN